MTRIPDPPKGMPMVPARLSWTDGSDMILKNPEGTVLMVPQFDPLLEAFVEQHEHGLEDSAWLERAVVEVVQVDQKTWDTQDATTKIKKALKEQTGKWYEERDEFRTSATECYNKHGNPTPTQVGGSGCPDYLDDSKRIGPAKHNIDGRIYNVPPQFRQYLCSMCPYQQSYINVELRRAKGYYDPTKRAKPIGR